MTLYYQGLTPFVYLEDLAGSGNIGAESADLHGESAWKITSVSGSARAGVARLQEMVARPEDVVVIEVPSDFVVPANPPVLDLDTRWRRHWLFERRFLVVGVHRQGPMLRTGLLRLRQQVEDDPSLPAHHPWPRARARVALPPGNSRHRSPSRPRPRTPTVRSWDSRFGVSRSTPVGAAKGQGSFPHGFRSGLVAAAVREVIEALPHLDA